MKKIVIACLVLSLAACAKKPENIEAADIGADTYKNYSCTQLGQERLKLTQALENLSAEQRQAANGDAWGVFLLGLPVSSMSGKDKETAISIAKGKVQAIDQMRLKKRCR